MEQVSNLAFTSLIFLLLAVPGYVARACYHSGNFTRHLLPRSWTDDIFNGLERGQVCVTEGIPHLAAMGNGTEGIR